MKSIIAAIALVLTSATGYAQLGKFLKDKMKNVDLKNVATDILDPEEETTKLREKQLQKDTSFYNFAIAQSSKAAFFESKEDNENLFFALAKNYEDENIEKVELELYEQAFEYNRKGSKLLYINNTVAATNFWSALGIYLEDDTSTVVGEAVLAAMLNQTSEQQAASLMGVMQALVQRELSREDHYAILKTTSNLSILYHSRGQYSMADQITAANIPLIEDLLGEESTALASELNNRGVVLKDLGAYTEAEAAFDKADDLLTSKGQKSTMSYSILLNNKAMLYEQTGRYKQAVANQLECIAIAEKELSSKGADFARFKINLGLLYQDQKQYDKAEEIYKQVLQLKEKRFGKRHQDYAAVQNHLASLYMVTNREDQVGPLLNSSAEIYQSKLGDQHPAYAATLVNLGKYHYLTGAPTKALESFNKALAIYKQNFGEYNPSYIEVLHQLGLTYWALNDINAATDQFNVSIEKMIDLLENYFPAMSENEKANYWAKTHPRLLEYYNFAIAQANTDPGHLTTAFELQLMTKGLLLNSTTKVKNKILNSDNKELIDLYENWVDGKEKLATYYTYSKADLQEQKIDLPTLEREVNGLERQLNQKSNAFATSFKLPQTKVEEVREQLGPGQAAVEIIAVPAFDKRLLDQHQYLFVIVKPDQEKLDWVVLNNGNELEGKFANAYRKQIAFKTADEYSYPQFWKPVQDHLTNVSQVFVSVDGIYSQINLGSLQVEEDQYLLDLMKVRIVASTRDLSGMSKETSKGSAVLVGAPDYGSKGTIAPLPGTKKEVENIREMMVSRGRNASMLTGQMASESSLKDDISKPQVLHIATHGFFLQDLPENGNEDVFGVSLEVAKENPLLRAGLMLTGAETAASGTSKKEIDNADNGILTAYEAMLLDLTGTEMVVLSACETGLGEVRAGEGVYGLQRAFQIAGAQSIVMSLWKVNDEATQLLMTRFYQNWLKGDNRFTAFEKAQLSLKEQYPEPYYWGAFVMVN